MRECLDRLYHVRCQSNLNLLATVISLDAFLQSMCMCRGSARSVLSAVLASLSREGYVCPHRIVLLDPFPGKQSCHGRAGESCVCSPRPAQRFLFGEMAGSLAAVKSTPVRALLVDNLTSFFWEDRAEAQGNFRQQYAFQSKICAAIKVAWSLHRGRFTTLHWDTIDRLAAAFY